VQPLSDSPESVAVTTGHMRVRKRGEAPSLQGSSNPLTGTWIKQPANLEASSEQEPGTRAVSVERRWRENGGNYTQRVRPAAATQPSDPITHSLQGAEDSNHKRSADRVWATTGIKHRPPPQSRGDPIRFVSYDVSALVVPGCSWNKHTIHHDHTGTAQSPMS
jgi:hypothetical protein